MPEESNKLKYEVQVEDGTTKPMSKIDTAMRMFTKRLGILGKQSAKTTQSVTQFAKRGLGKLGSAAQYVVKEIGGVVSSLSGFSSVLVGGALIGGIVGLIKYYNDYASAVADLNAVQFINQRAISESAKVMQGFGRELGYSREELAAVTAQGLELGIFSKNTKQAAANFKEWTKQTILLSKATGLATSTVGDMGFQLGEIYGLGYRPLRNIGAAFKYVADMSSISADELATFTKGLEPVLLALPGLSKKAKVSLTTDMMALAGIFSDVGLESSKLTDMFGTMAKRIEGADMRSAFGQLIGKTEADVLKSIRSGKIANLVKQFSVAMNKVSDPDQLEMISQAYGETLGLNFIDLTKWRRLGGEGGRVFDETMARVTKAAKEAKIQQEAAEARMTRISKAMNIMKLAFEDFFLMLGERFTKGAEAPLERLANGLRRFAKWLQKESQPGGAVDQFITRMVSGFKEIRSTAKFIMGLPKVFEYMTDTITGWITTIVGFVKKIPDQLMPKSVVAFKQRLLVEESPAVQNTVKSIKQLLQLSRTIGTVGGPGGRRTPITQSFAQERLQSSLRGATKEERAVAMEQARPLIRQLPASAPPTVNVSTGSSEVVNAINRQNALLQGVKDSIDRQSTPIRRAPGLALSLSSGGG